MKGEVESDDATRAAAARDTSLFKVTPALVVCPEDAADVQAIVKTVRAAKDAGEDTCLAARAAGPTCLAARSREASSFRSLST